MLKLGRGSALWFLHFLLLRGVLFFGKPRVDQIRGTVEHVGQRLVGDVAGSDHVLVDLDIDDGSLLTTGGYIMA